MQIILEESNFTVFMFVAVLNRGVGGQLLMLGILHYLPQKR